MIPRQYHIVQVFAAASLWIRSNPEWLLNLDHIAVRDEAGNLVQVIYRDINISADYTELLHARVEYLVDTRCGLFMPQIGYSRYLLATNRTVRFWNK